MIPGQPSSSVSLVPNDDPVLRLMKTTSENAVASKNRARIERERSGDVGDNLPKNKERTMYAISRGGVLAYTHRQ